MIVGALAWTATAPVAGPLVGLDMGPVEIAAGLPLATFAALLPDVDHPDSLASRGWLPMRGKFGIVGKILAFLISVPPRVIGFLARSVMGHRGGTHSLLFCVLWSFGFLPLYGLMAAGIAYLLGTLLASTPLAFDPTWLWEWEKANAGAVFTFVVLAVAIGYLSHLVVDSFNTVPVPWLWPFTKRRFFFLPKGLRIRVESPAEWLFRMLVTLAFFAAVWIFIVAPAATIISEHVSTPAVTQSQ